MALIPIFTTPRMLHVLFPSMECRVAMGRAWRTLAPAMHWLWPSSHALSSALQYLLWDLAHQLCPLKTSPSNPCNPYIPATHTQPFRSQKRSGDLLVEPAIIVLQKIRFYRGLP